MAGRGPAPKAVRSRARDSEAREAELTEIEDTGEHHGPPLPDDVLPNGETWHPMTLRLWETLRTHAPLADEPDLGWLFLIDTMLMHHSMWSTGKFTLAQEVRLRLAKFAATPEDRMRMKMKIVSPIEEIESPVGGARDDASRDRRRNLRIAE